MKRTYFVAIVLILLAVQVRSQSGNALPWRLNTAYNAYLMRQVHQQYAERQQALSTAFQSKENMLRYCNVCREKYRSIIGELPKETPLNAQIQGFRQFDGFKVEQVLFESIPQRYVTANLYIPDGKGPFPAALEVCGHGSGGKIPAPEEALLLVKNGFVVLVVDPVGQGERLQLLDDDSNPATRGATTEHTLLSAGCNLVGTSVAAVEYWDNHRAIDYLVSRPEVDKNRIGVFGSSGGGTQTSYMLGLDDRIKVAAVCSYFSKRERVLELNGPSDGCQHIPGEGREQLEIADFVLMCAPKPVLIMSGLYDFVDYWGAALAFDELKKAYTVLGEPQNVNLFTTEGGHGMPKLKREAMVTWFRTWLCNDDKPVRENQLPQVPDSVLQCTKSGQVFSSIADAISIPLFNQQEMKKYAPQRAAFTRTDSSELRQKVLGMLGIQLPAEKIQPEQTGLVKSRNYDLLKYQIIRSGQMPVPCVVVVPEKINPKGKVVIYLNEAGKDQILNDENTVGAFVNSGDVLVLADLRGKGETTDPASLNDTKYWNSEYRNAMTSLHIGTSIVGQRVIDLLSLVDFVSGERKLDKLAIKVVANGIYGPVTVHAAYLDRRIKSAEITRSIKSYGDLLSNPMQYDVFSNVLYGVLTCYDLKDLIRVTGNPDIRFAD
jgi:dienelactone hydrolase